MNKLAKILDALHHYWYMKGFITDKMMSKALHLIENGTNPFMVPHFNLKLRSNAPEHYAFSHDAFKIELQNERDKTIERYHNYLDKIKRARVYAQREIYDKAEWIEDELKALDHIKSVAVEILNDIYKEACL